EAVALAHERVDRRGHHARPARPAARRRTATRRRAATRWLRLDAGDENDAGEDEQYGRDQTDQDPAHDSSSLRPHAARARTLPRHKEARHKRADEGGRILYERTSLNLLYSPALFPLRSTECSEPESSGCPTWASPRCSTP